MEHINPLNPHTSIPNSDSRTRGRKQDQKEQEQLKRRQKVRKRIEEIELAMELGIKFDDLY